MRTAFNVGIGARRDQKNRQSKQEIPQCIYDQYWSCIALAPVCTVVAVAHYPVNNSRLSCNCNMVTHYLKLTFSLNKTTLSLASSIEWCNEEGVHMPRPGMKV